MNYKNIEIPFWCLRYSKNKPDSKLSSKYSNVDLDFLFNKNNENNNNK
jgi:hypothetical protein